MATLDNSMLSRAQHSEVPSPGAPMPMADAVMTTSPQIDERTTVHRFVSLAVNGLVPMFDQQQQLFCYGLKKTDQGMVREGLSQRYTMMALMGLHRLEESGGTSPFDAKRILANLFSNLDWVDNIGDLGVLLWMSAIVCPDKLGELQSKLDLGSALTRFRGARQAITMELSWFLTGLAYFADLDPKESTQLEPIALSTYKMISQNQGDRGFFGHLSTRRSLRGLTRGRIGSFADQVYPIYGMAQFAKAYSHDEALNRALRCATAICEAQGSMGQWWWHYDAPAGCVADGYPVFSVHQHAMGPMTLFKIGEVANRNFNEWIYKGLNWINSNNELSFDMENGALNLIWRCIFRSRRSLGRYLKAGHGSFKGTVPPANPAELKVLYECRSYELGWLLYAFGGRRD